MTNEQTRPDPDSLLGLAKEAEQSRGKLKIFLGYAAGVGKTFAMLEAARRRKTDGLDVVVAYVETHRRVETEALLSGLEVLHRKVIEYKGTVVPEMDLDAVLKRRPHIAIVDELAHTNAPDSRHLKRYQDVEEILACGIDVYTTLNIQHLESLNDVIAQITNVVMKETIPDRIIDEAAEIEVVDIPIGELLQRLKEGRVYLGEQAARAAQNFFNEGNLNALREITLRRAAQRVDDQVQSYIKRKAISGPWPASERLLVCITSHPASDELVRAGRLLAAGFDAEWFVVYVETSKSLSEVNRDRVLRTLQMAEQLGATTVTLFGHHVPQEIMNYARRTNITKIILGKPLKRNLSHLFKGTIVDQVIEQSGDIDIHVITPKKTGKIKSEEAVVPHKSLSRYFKSTLLVVIVSLFGWVIRTWLAPTNLVMFYLLAVVIAAIRWGRGPSVLVALFSVLVFDFFFVPPYLTFAVSDAQYFLTFAALFVVGLIISRLTAQTRDQAINARIREAQATALYNLSRHLTAAKDITAIVDIISTHFYQTFLSPVAIFLKEGAELNLQKDPGYPVTQHERAVAVWVFQNKQPAGWGTDTLPAASAHYVPLKTTNAIFGVLGVKFNLKSERLPLDERRLLETFATQIALAIERVLLVEESRQAHILRETEKLQNALFNSISHDLRTPLVSITGTLSSLMGEQPESSDRRDLLENAYEQATRMNRLVGNLLDMAKVEAGALKISKKLSDVQELIAATLEQFRGELNDRKVTVDIPPGLPEVKMDFTLMMKVLFNVLDNAIKYSPFNLPIDIKARINGNNIEMIVMDRGIGIPEQDLEQIFNKFYRVQRPENFEGTGLGLSICKAIVEAHQGKIWAENRPGGGSILTIALPLDAKT